ncbi:MAG: hypothetical protein K2M03_06035 [Muribaculaceae bacterium]|nr:hypothetical protein [Muribaculaceae bacterium]
MKALKMMLCLMLICMGVSACSNQEEAASVAKKIESGEVLNQGDYTVIIKYLGSFAEKAQPIQNKINNMSSENPEAVQLADEIDKMRESNKYLELFTNTLKKATEAEVGADNVNLVNNYAGYEWFTSPDWATINADPGVAGMVVETPDAGQDTGVVAGAVDEETVRDL